MALRRPFSRERKQNSTPPLTAPANPDGEELAEAAALTTAAELAEKIQRTGMAGPALVLLHALKPLAWTGGQMLWMLEPFTGSGRGAARSPLSIPGLARFLEREGSVDELIQRLGQMGAEPVARSGGAGQADGRR